MKKTLKILCNSFCFPSTMLLRNSLEKFSGLKILVTDNPSMISNGFLFLRYGNSGHTDESINSPEFISLASNKLAFSRLCKEHEIYAPEFFNSGIPDNYPAMIRTTLFGKHAEGISIVENGEQFNQLWRAGFYWTPYKILRSEFRVHVAFGEILKVFKKEDNVATDRPIRISDNCHFSLVAKPLPKLVELVTKLNSVIDSNSFYGLDVAWEDKTKSYFVLEINSAPGLNEMTSELYAKAILVKKGIEINEIYRTTTSNT